MSLKKNLSFVIKKKPKGIFESIFENRYGGQEFGVYGTLGKVTCHLGENKII